MAELTIDVVIPTYGREKVLLDTIDQLLKLDSPADGIIIVDQTPTHEASTESLLATWHDERQILWHRRDRPSIPGAMNAGLRLSTADLVLYLDDDVLIDEQLIATHRRAHQLSPEAWAVAGQVLQPGESPAPRGEWTAMSGIWADMDFPFWSTEPAWLSNVMAGNLSVRRDLAIRCGGFDENFVGVAYRFETEFARRIIAKGGRILFEPQARIQHLRAPRGGTRAGGSHLTSASPLHGMGDYYFALQSGLSPATCRYMLRRPIREVATRFHLRHPWYIPVKLVGEFRAIFAAVRMWRRGPSHIQNSTHAELSTHSEENS